MRQAHRLGSRAVGLVVLRSTGRAPAPDAARARTASGRTTSIVNHGEIPRSRYPDCEDPTCGLRMQLLQGNVARLLRLRQLQPVMAWHLDTQRRPPIL